METTQDTHMETTESKTTTNNVAEVIFNGTPGLGFGLGTISRTDQLHSGELTENNEQIGFEYIINDRNAFVTVDKQDDGCSDGRIAIYAEKIRTDGTVEQSEESLRRGKIFGGGTMTTVAGKIGVGIIAPTTDAQFDNALNYLKARNVKFGAHDDDHANGENCGCGAIDRYPDNIKNTQHFKSEIKDAFVTLFGDDFNDEIFENVSENFRHVYGIVANEAKYSGKTIRDRIAKTGAVVKRLTGKHQEDFIVINFVEDTTLNQPGLVEATDGNVQAFCLDAWKLSSYARIIADGDPILEQKALYGMLMYTLATSGTLTDGTQRVLVRNSN